MIESWRLSLEAANKSPKTVRSYTDSALRLCDFLDEHQFPADAEGVEPSDIQQFLLAERERTSAASAAVHFRNLRVFFGWVVSEGERSSVSPMEGVARPTVPKQHKPPFSDEELQALLKVCSGISFEDRRDTAILRVLIDTGMRVSSLAGLHYAPDDEDDNDVDLRKRALRVRKKGGDTFSVPIGKRAATSLDRYLRMRARHVAADSPYLWLGVKGHGIEQMTDSGIRQMLTRRGKQARVTNVHPHRFRRTFADDWLESGGNLDDLMQIAGWKTFAMVREYTEARAAERAHQAHKRLSPGDKI